MRPMPPASPQQPCSVRPPRPRCPKSGLIKKPALPPLEEREPIGGEELLAQEESPRVVSLGPLKHKTKGNRPNEVRNSLDRIADRLEAPAVPSADNEDEVEAPAAPVAPAIKPSLTRSKAVDKGKRAAFTLRLDQDRHLMLRLACTVRGSSAQQLVTDALDQLLSEMPEIAMLAAQVQQRPN